MSANPSVNLACAIDDRYALPLAVTLRSAVEALEPQTNAEIYVVDDGVTPENRRKIDISIRPRANLHWIARPAEEHKDLPNWGRMSLTTYRKLTLGEWLPPEVHRVLWLDADLLILRDVVRLWKSDLHGQIALAVPDAMVPFVSSRFGVAAHRELNLSATQKYFNAGVLLIDIERWRRENVMPRAFDYLQRYGERVFFWDQEALNAVLAGHWGELDPRWNWNPIVDCLTDSSVEPFIVHFTGNLKPWRYRGSNRYQKAYDEIVDLTAWRGERPRGSWTMHWLGKYESSRLRRLLYPLEQFYLRLVRWRSFRHFHRSAGGA